MAVQTQIQTRRGTAATWTSTNPTLAAGEIGFESDTGKFKIGTGSTAWNSLAYSAGATAVTYLYNATSGQTTFSGTDANGLTLAYTVGAEQVFLNGVLQVRGTDYTATNGTSVVLASGAVTSDVLNIIAYSALTITDTYTQAQADAKFVQQTNNFFAGKNKIINGDMNIWQRGTSITAGTGTVYNADRFYSGRDGSGATVTVSRQQFTAGTAPVTGYESLYFLRFNQSVAGSGGSYSVVGQRIEGATTLANQTATVSFWAKADTSRTITLNFNRSYGTGGSADNFNIITAPSFNLTTSWQRFTASFTIPSVAGKTIADNGYLEMNFFLSPNTVQTVDFWGVQLEAGSIATPFQTATGTIQGELAACQRYYYKHDASGTVNTSIAAGGYYSASTYIVPISFPVTMRVAPTAAVTTVTSGYQILRNGGLNSLNSLTQETANKNTAQMYNNSEASGTIGFYGQLTSQNASTSIAWSAEL
jgi:hypothetical protein